MGPCFRTFLVRFDHEYRSYKRNLPTHAKPSWSEIVHWICIPLPNKNWAFNCIFVILKVVKHDLNGLTNCILSVRRYVFHSQKYGASFNQEMAQRRRYERFELGLLLEWDRDRESERKRCIFHPFTLQSNPSRTLAFPLRSFAKMAFSRIHGFIASCSFHSELLSTFDPFSTENLNSQKKSSIWCRTFYVNV